MRPLKKSLATSVVTLLLMAAAITTQAAPTPEQQNQIENCKILSGAVFEFAEARDHKQSKMDAFKNVTHGQSYVPGSLLDETLQWAFAHADEQPDTSSAHFYGRCVLDAYEVLNPDSEGELDVSAMACQQAHPGAPDAVRDCIDTTAHDIVARVQSAAQTAVAAAASSAAPAAATVTAAVQAPSSATVVASAPPPAVASTPPSAPAAPNPVPVATPAIETTAPVAAPVAAAPAPVMPVAAPAASVAQSAPMPPREVTHVAPAVSAPAPIVAVAQAPQAVAPVTAPQPVVPVAPLPPVAAMAPPPAPVVAKAAAPQPVAAPLPSLRDAPKGEFPPDLTGFGKLTVGMSMEDAYKALGSHGEIDRDEQGEVHTYMIGDDHGFIELRPSSTGTLHSIRVVGGADAHVAPVLGVVLGDGAFLLINSVGLPSSRTPLPGDKELWNYLGRNYAFEISPGGDVIGLRIIDMNDDPGAAQ